MCTECGCNIFGMAYMEPVTIVDASTDGESGQYPKQGIKPRMKIDVNSHGIRRETSLDPKPKKTRPKKV